MTIVPLRPAHTMPTLGVSYPCDECGENQAAHFRMLIEDNDTRALCAWCYRVERDGFLTALMTEPPLGVA